MFAMTLRERAYALRIGISVGIIADDLSLPQAKEDLICSMDRNPGC
jgi:hypothetical protein